MKPRIRKLKGFQVIGLKTRTSLHDELEPKQVTIADLWFQLLDKGLIYQIPRRVNRTEYLTLFSNYKNGGNGAFTSIAGQRVFDVDEVPQGLEVIQVPRGKYLVFSLEAENPNLKRFWQRIEAFFARSSKYQRAFTTDFEADRWGPGRIDVYVAIK